MSILKSLASLETAEDFFDRFGIPYDQPVLDVYRLHILQRMHDRLAVIDLDAQDLEAQADTVAAALAAAYQDFVLSDAQTEKVFKVFRRTNKPAAPAGRAVVALAEIRGVGSQG